MNRLCVTALFSTLLLGLSACSASSTGTSTASTPQSAPPEEKETPAAVEPLPVQGASSTREYEILVDAPKEAKVGEPVNVVVTLTPAAGLKVNEEFPHKLTLSNVPDGVECPKTELRAGAGEGKVDAEKFAPELASFVLVCTPNEAGPKEFSGEYRFSVCNDSLCATPKVPLAWKIDVK